MGLPIAGRSVPLAATRVYQLSFFTGFGVSAIVYYLLNAAFPVPGASKTFEEVDVSGYESTTHDTTSKFSDENGTDSKGRNSVDMKIEESLS
jgi:NCS1 family nucleobase:cation symporter-1